MGFEHRIDRERRLVWVTARGPIDLYSTLRETMEIASDPALGEGYRILADLREMEHNLSVDELWTVARLQGAQGKTFRSMPQAAIVDGPFYYGIVCLFATIGRPFGLRVRSFLSVEKGLAWLDAIAPIDAPGAAALLPENS